MTRGATRRGFAREIKVARYLRAEGWVAFTTKNDGQEHDDKRHSHGIVDVVALRRRDCWDTRNYIRLIQVKSTKRPYERFGPAERAELLAEAKAAGAIAELWHWPAHARTPTVIPSSSWPS